VSPTLAERLIVIGDIHGDATRLGALLRLLSQRTERLIFVGDYVNRGPASREVIQQLLDLQQKRPETCFLLGNHDLAFETYLTGGNFAPFARMGGIATIKSYIPGIARKDVRQHLVDVVPHAHRVFLANLGVYTENEYLLVSHAGFDPENPTDRSLEAMVMGDRRSVFEQADTPGKIAVFGHHLQGSGRPFISRRLVCLDTGCGSRGGPLTAMLFPDRVQFRV
jgi:serine/threonine protein phosphatase 1